jgi:hypothetical protein
VLLVIDPHGNGRILRAQINGASDLTIQASLEHCSLIHGFPSEGVAVTVLAVKPPDNGSGIPRLIQSSIQASDVQSRTAGEERQVLTEQAMSPKSSEEAA